MKLRTRRVIARFDVSDMHRLFSFACTVQCSSAQSSLHQTLKNLRLSTLSSPSLSGSPTPTRHVSFLHAVLIALCIKNAVWTNLHDKTSALMSKPPSSLAFHMHYLMPVFRCPLRAMSSIWVTCWVFYKTPLRLGMRNARTVNTHDLGSPPGALKGTNLLKICFVQQQGIRHSKLRISF